MTEQASKPWASLCAIGIVATLAFSAIAGTLGVPAIEVALRGSILAWGYPEVTDVAALVNHAGTWRVLLPGAILLLLLPHMRRRWWLWLGVLVAGPLLGDLWQPLVGRLRPDEGALGFPSGHATSIATFGVSAIYLLGRSSLPRAPLRIGQWLVALLILAVGLARIFAGAHWPVDVLGGFALGSSVAAGAAWWDATHPEASTAGAQASHDGPIPAR